MVDWLAVIYFQYLPGLEYLDVHLELVFIFTWKGVLTTGMLSAKGSSLVVHNFVISVEILLSTALGAMKACSG